MTGKLSGGLRSEVQRIVFLAIFLGVAGYFNGYMAFTLIGGGGLYMLWTLTRIQRLYRWLEKGGRHFPPHATGVWGDISDQLYQLQQRDRRNRQNYRALIGRIRNITGALEEGVIVLNAEKCLDWWNPAAGELLGLRKEDAHQVFTNLIRAPAFMHFINHPPYDEPLELAAPGNQQRLLQFSASPFGDNEIVLVVQDLTHLRNLEAMRKEFVANISHELRTPLTVLTGYIETLSDHIDHNADDIPPLWRKALTQMDEQTQRLNLLTDDLMMLSQLESTPSQPVTQAIELKALLLPILDSARALSKGQHHFQLECADDLSIAGSAQELHSAFSNIVYNAVKHNPAGCHIQVSVTRGPNTLGDSKLDTINVAISDDGMGIDPIHLPRLTERFYRADNSRATSSGGTGLGLAIVKHVLARNGGELHISSTLGKGSTFTCSFSATDPDENP